ncbi:hypothetical protein PDE_09046 [Penicillium oxalicum 114-2]|uniref:Uncharacterized protein n=1 Tax=Penicillium oxalicum (strain 114-2 / CGMCC 5302) TaxID=933388 RepID=S7ZUG3_PENO1|nr:hypothetical protein PDE_09046 [Penicillium oxalicum 114-2]
MSSTTHLHLIIALGPSHLSTSSDMSKDPELTLNRSDENVNKETLSGVEPAAPVPSLRQSDQDRLSQLDEREAALAAWDATLRQREDYMATRETNVTNLEIENYTKLARVDDLDRERERLERVRQQVDQRSEDVFRPLLDQRMRTHWDNYEALKQRYSAINCELDRANEKATAYDRLVVNWKESVAAAAEQEWISRKDQLERQAMEAIAMAERKAAITEDRNKGLEGQIAMSNTTTLALRAQLNEVTERYEKVKGEQVKYRENEEAAVKRVQWGTSVDADQDTPIRGNNDDPEVSLVAALKEIDRLKELHRAESTRLTGELETLREEKTEMTKTIAALEALPELNALAMRLSQMGLTDFEEGHAAVQTEDPEMTAAAVQTDLKDKTEVAPWQVNKIKRAKRQVAMLLGQLSRRNAETKSLRALNSQLMALNEARLAEQQAENEYEQEALEGHFQQLLAEATSALQQQVRQLEESSAQALTLMADTPAQSEAQVQTESVVILSAEQWTYCGTLEGEVSSLREHIQRQKEQFDSQVNEYQELHKKSLDTLAHICGLEVPAETLRDLVDDALKAFEEISRAYQDPAMSLQLVTLLGPNGRLKEHLEDLEISADLVLDGLKKTDDGVPLRAQVDSIRQALPN